MKAKDRTPFLQVADAVSQQISSFPKGAVSVLMGESFGGLLALYVASTANAAPNRRCKYYHTFMYAYFKK